jgi:hypothetical protein
MKGDCLMVFILCQTGLRRRDRRIPCAAREAARLLGVRPDRQVFPGSTGRPAPADRPAFEIWNTRCGVKIVLLAGRDWLEASLVSGSIESIVGPA